MKKNHSHRQRSLASRYPKPGLRIVGHRGPPEVSGAYVRFAKWLREHYEFPVRVPVYLASSRRIITVDGVGATASFFVPDDWSRYPYVRIATGDYGELRAEKGRDNALAAMLHSLAHELIHYWQWLETDSFTERGVVVKASHMIWKYASDVDSP